MHNLLYQIAIPTFFNFFFFFRIEQLISEHEIETTGLTEKASSARSQANSIQSQLEIIQYVCARGLKLSHNLHF